jgi:hypothetical protein
VKVGQTEPQGNTEPASLVLPRGATDLDLGVGSQEGRLLTSQFSGPQPKVTQAPGVVIVRYPRSFRRTTGRITLDPAAEWTIAARGPALRWRADLSGVGLASIHIDGGAKQTHIVLPETGKRVLLEISGGADRVTIVRPPTVAADLTIDGGASGLVFDQQQLGGIGGTVRLQSNPGETLGGSYDIRIGSGASRLNVTITDLPDTHPPGTNRRNDDPKGTTP